VEDERGDVRHLGLVLPLAGLPASFYERGEFTLERDHAAVIVLRASEPHFAGRAVDWRKGEILPLRWDASEARALSINGARIERYQAEELKAEEPKQSSASGRARGTRAGSTNGGFGLSTINAVR
jgi:hypothetical protein